MSCGLISLANAHAPSAVLAFSNRFKIAVSRGWAKTIRKRYVWKRISMKTEKKIVFKRKRIRVDGALRTVPPNTDVFLQRL